MSGNISELMNIPGATAWTINDGSIFDSSIPLIKAKYELTIDNFDPEAFMALLNEKRSTWDQNVTIYESLFSNPPDLNVCHYALGVPIPFMKAKDFVEKTIRFEQNGTHYSYSSYVPDQACNTEGKYDRCHTIVGGSILKKEGENRYVYYVFSQMNLYLSSFVKMAVTKLLPGKLKEFYDQIKQYAITEAVISVSKT